MPSFAVVKSVQSMSEGVAPEWLVAQMPPGYRNRYEEIQRLTGEIQGMDRVGRLLWELGIPLCEAVHEAFASLKTDPQWMDDGSCMAVTLGSGKRLLVHVAGTDGPVERKSDSITSVFRVLQEAAGTNDRAVLLTTGDRDLPPKERGDTLSAEALDLVRRMGVNVLPATTLFNMWLLSLTELNEARTYLDLLHGQDGGPFKLKSGK